MNYKRNKGFPFSIAQFMLQLTAFVKENGHLPETIYLPPEEYCYLTFFRCKGEDWKVLIPWDNFNGIHLEIENVKQENEFYY